MTEALMALAAPSALAAPDASRAAAPGAGAPAQDSKPSPGCAGFDAKACEAAARRIVQQASSTSIQAVAAAADTPQALQSMAQLARDGVLHLATPPSVKPGPDGIAARPNERFISVQGTINGMPATLLTAVAERDNAGAAWRYIYTVGAGAVQTRIAQQPIAGQPGRFVTTLGPLDPELDSTGFGSPVTLPNTGPLVVQAADDGRSARATIDGIVVFPASFLP